MASLTLCKHIKKHHLELYLALVEEGWNVELK
jgi:hypothetical protein